MMTSIERRKIMKLARILIVAAGMACASVALHAAQYPARTLEVVPAGAPGGGLDLVARGLEQAMREEKLLKESFAIKNMGGAGGNLAKAYIHQKKGDAHFLYLESNRIFVNRIVGTTHLTTTDFTPLGRLMTEYLVWVVRADSPYKTARDVLAKLKADPASVTFGVGTLPGNDQMNILRPAVAQGVDAKQVKIVAFKAGGDLMIQLLGGHVPVISTGLSEAVEQVKAGQARFIAISAPQQVAEFAKVPTWRSMGVDVSILHWRGLFGPPGIPDDVVRYWDQTLAKLTKSESWKKVLERHQWFDAYADSATFRRDLAREEKTYAELLSQLGLAKAAPK
jgi:putative tricarboxylic transport membrane protein